MNHQRKIANISLDEFIKEFETHSGQSKEIQTFPPPSLVSPSQYHTNLPFQSIAGIPLTAVNDQTLLLSAYNKLFSHCYAPALQGDNLAFPNSHLTPSLNVPDIICMPFLANLQAQVSQIRQAKLLDLVSRDLSQRYQHFQLNPSSQERTSISHVVGRTTLPVQSQPAQTTNLNAEMMQLLQRLVSMNSATTSTEIRIQGNPDTSTLENESCVKGLVESKEGTSNAPVNTSVNRSLTKKRSRPNDMPLHPLTAYNFFFSEEREKILSVLSKGESIEEMEDDDSNYKLNPEEMQLSFMLHLKKQREQKKKKRLHRKTHGKISFKSLAKLIGKRWKQLSSVKQAYYHKLAEMGMERYRAEMANYKKRKIDCGEEDSDQNKNVRFC